MAKHSKKKKYPPKGGRVGATPRKEIIPGMLSGITWTILCQALLITAAVLWIYWPVLHGDWLWDDDQLVSENGVVHDPSGLWRIWFVPGSLLDYQPLKFSVSWLQWQLWGSDTLGYHLTNIFLHIVGALLVWRLLGKFGLRWAWLGGLIFAIHPVQVESVAWIAELKNTLSLPPFLLAMCAWIDFDERGRKKDYFLAVGLFLAAMLCKPTMVMFPFVILLYAWWKRGRIEWYDVRIGAQFFVISLVLGLVTVWFLHSHTVGEGAVAMGGFFSRLACAGLAISFYFSTCFLPVGLLPIYPRWVVDPPTLVQFLPWPILALVIFWLWKKRESWGRHALLGLGFFLINLAPFVGFNAGSYMVYTWVMDHVLYIPIIGLIGLVVAALEGMGNQLPLALRPFGIGLVTVLMVLLAFGSHGYAAHYIDSEALWSYELQHNRAAYSAHNNLGRALAQKGLLPEATDQFTQALMINPYDSEAHNNLGLALFQTGHEAEAMAQYKLALQINPGYADAYYNRANAYLQTKRYPEAIDQYKQTLRIDPDYVGAHCNLGCALYLTGQMSEALKQFEITLKLNPHLDIARINLDRLQAQLQPPPANN